MKLLNAYLWGYKNPEAADHSFRKFKEFYPDGDTFIVVDNTGDEDDKMIAVFLDIEATGLSYTQDKLIELGIVKFEYNRHGSIFRLLDDFNGYQDPGIPIPEYITKLTGINDDMVRGQQIEENAVANYLQDVDLIIAHNAQFDRTFLEIGRAHV